MKENCDICFRIICKQCGWEADNEAAQKIAIGELIACPICGWSPNFSA